MENQYRHYGSDRSGLIYGFIFNGKEAAQELHSEQAFRLIKDPNQLATDHFIWLHFNLSNASTERWLREHSQCPNEFYDILHQGSRSTRIEHADQQLIAVINDVVHDFSFDPSEIATLWLSISPRVLISTRRKPLKSVDHLRDAVNRGEIFQSSMVLLTHLLRDQADVLTEIVRITISRIDEVEDHLLADRLSKRRANLGELRRVLVRLQRLLAPEPAALFRLLQKPPNWMSENDVRELRQSSEEFAVVLSDIASLQERIKLLQEEIAAHVNEQNNRSLFVLTIVTVLALPINITTGLFGMNVGGIPYSQHEFGFWIVILIVSLITGIAGWFAFRSKNHD
ncbi:transporter [Undibacterium fentianense]|uniref:Transporter n=1 Tax=Undibacterium fentianense TaxID=2828728 RepID=A0A941IFF7_9BURK|nr:transporter [Undibacterium fentianense]MBR7800327.1 transporter [Undibacterium fentianense]